MLEATPSPCAEVSFGPTSVALSHPDLETLANANVGAGVRKEGIGMGDAFLGLDRLDRRPEIFGQPVDLA
ncbi:hypothetical protein ACIK7D_27230 [Agrobacterium sp. P15N1-A]